MSQADFDKWQTRYLKTGEEIAAAPEPFVVDATSRLDVGRAVDIAGGTGRHALQLLAQGWSTTLIDIAPAALKIARRAAADSAHLTTAAVDLDDSDATAVHLAPHRFDLVVCTWFLPPPSLWVQIVTTLSPQGHLVYVQPTQRNIERHPKPSARFLFDDDRLGDHLASLGLTVLRYEEGWDSRGHHTARALAAMSETGT